MVPGMMRRLQLHSRHGRSLVHMADLAMSSGERVFIMTASERDAERLARDLQRAGLGLQIQRGGSVVEIEPCTLH